MKQLKEVFPQFRITKTRLELFEILKNTHSPVSLATILNICTISDRATVYRNLDLFIRMQIAIVVPVGWKKKYELSDLFKPHHHHLQCQNCGKLIDVGTPRLESLVNELATDQNFTLTFHHIELYGLCSNCRKIHS